MQRCVSLGVLIVTAVLALTLGTLAGAVSGGLTAFVVSGDSTPTETAATGRPVAEPVRSSEQTVTPTPTPEPPPSSAPPAASNESASIADIVERVSPAVVTVVNKQVVRGPFGDSESETEPAGTGTGFIIDDQGHIVTNHHVVDGSQEIQVIFSDGREAAATLLGSDAFADLAVIQVEPPVPAVVPFGDSDKLRPGDRVLAIGSALGDFTNTVTDGIVSGLGRSLDTPEGYNMENMIQHDAPINPGNSGGPLLNMRGEVVGVNTAVVRQAGLGITAEGLGFAIPSKTVQSITQELIANGRVERPFLGITYQPITPRAARASELPVDHGVYVEDVEPGSPAAAAGIQPGDIVTKINGQQIDSEHPLVNLLFEFEVGETIEIEIHRPDTGETLTVEATLAQRPDNT